MIRGGLVACALAVAASLKTQDCIGRCRALHAAGCCEYYGGAAPKCLWSPQGSVEGARQADLPVWSSNCYLDGVCDGWNPGKVCSGELRPVPASPPAPPPSPSPAQWKLAWSDEFDACPDGRPDPANWGYERGYFRNHEEQWYQPDNAACVDGNLEITARREHPAEAPQFNYTSSSLTTKGKRQFGFGRYEMRGRIPIESGSWPAWWAVGPEYICWPMNGEIDMMEAYNRHVRINVAMSRYCWAPVWNDALYPVDEAWASEFHVWAVERDAEEIRLFLDGRQVNRQKLLSGDLQEKLGVWDQPMHLNLNLAIGSRNGGDPSQSHFPLKFYVDYVRVYEPAAGPGVFV